MMKIFLAPFFGFLMFSGVVFSQDDAMEEEEEVFPIEEPLEDAPDETLPPDAEPPPADLEPEPIEEPETLPPEPSGSTTQDARPDFQDPFATEADQPVESEPSLPAFGPGAPAQEQPVMTPPPIAPAPIAPAPNPTPTPARDFRFPEPGRPMGPVTQEVLRLEQAQMATTAETWSLELRGGGAFKLNNNTNQAALEVQGSYRLDPRWEVAGIATYRYIRTDVIALIGLAKYYFRLTAPESRRVEMNVNGGLGWGLRRRFSSFNDHRLFLRTGSDIAFYAWPQFALVGGLAIESVFVSIVAGSSRNLFKGAGLPFQALALGGVRFEF
jgi:hypothetical protein